MKTRFYTFYPIYKTLISLFLISISSFLYSQNKPENCSNSIQDTSIYEENLAGELFLDVQLYYGKNYYNDNWYTGTLVLENGEQVYNKQINYHLLTHKLVWLRDIDQSLIVVRKEIVKEFIVPNDSGGKSLFKKIKFKVWDKPDSVEEYLQVLSTGTINLYAFRKSIIGQKSQKLFPVDEYYIQDNHGNIKRLKMYRRFLYSAVNENRDLMKKIVRSNHLRIRQEKGLIKAVDIFNQEIIEVKK